MEPGLEGFNWDIFKEIKFNPIPPISNSIKKKFAFQETGTLMLFSMSSDLFELIKKIWPIHALMRNVWDQENPVLPVRFIGLEKNSEAIDASVMLTGVIELLWFLLRNN